MTVLSIPEGEDVTAFVAGAGARDGLWARAVGALEGVELAVARDGAEEVRVVPGRVTLLSLSGPPAGPLMAIVGSVEGGEPRVVGGRLVRARSAGVSLMIDVSAPSRAEAPAARGAGKTGAASPGKTGRAGWPALADSTPPEDDDETDEAPKFGDFVDHFVFGLCEVMTVRGERMKIRDLTGAGKLREIHLGAVKVLKPTEQDGRRVFKLAKRG